MVITDRGRPAHVLMTIGDFRRLTGAGMSLAQAIEQRGDGDFAFDPPKVKGLHGVAELG